MTSATVNRTAENLRTGLADKAMDAYHQASHMAEEARRLTNDAAGAVDDGIYIVRRAVNTAKRSAQDAAAYRDVAISRMKDEPLKAVALAFGVGILAGAIVGWACRPRVSQSAGRESAGDFVAL